MPAPISRLLSNEGFMRFEYLALTMAGLVLYYFARKHRIKKITDNIKKNLESKISNEILSNPEISSQQKKLLEKLKKEVVLDAIQSVGGACYNFLSLNHAEKIVSDASNTHQVISETIKDNLVFDALSRRYDDYDTESIVQVFNHHLNNQNLNLLKGDIGEQVGAQLRESQGFIVEFPTGADGSWKSNQEGFDYTVKSGESIFKENPKIGYHENFSKIKEQAIKNPDVHYITGDEHENEILKSGLDNIHSHSELNDSNITEHINNFKQHSNDFVESKVDLLNSHENLDSTVNDLASGEGSMSVPWLSLTLSGINHARLIKNGDIEPGEALANTVVKTAIKTGLAKGGGGAGAQLGFVVGGPVGAIVGGALGALAGSSFGTSIFVAWKEEAMMKIYVSQLKTLSEIAKNTSEDLDHKIIQTSHYRSKIRYWMFKNIHQILWPTEGYVVNSLTYKYLEIKREDFKISISILNHSNFEINKLTKKFNESGFFGRFFGETQELEKDARKVTEVVFEEVQKSGAIRMNLLDRKVSKWSSDLDKINREKRKVAA